MQRLIFDTVISLFLFFVLLNTNSKVRFHKSEICIFPIRDHITKTEICMLATH